MDDRHTAPTAEEPVASEARLARIERWRRLLRQDRGSGFMQPEIPIEQFYNEATGLPE